MVRLEQKSAGWMQNLDNSFLKPGELETNLFSGTFAIAKACLELPRHVDYVDCEVGVDCFVADTEELVETHVR